MATVVAKTFKSDISGNEIQEKNLVRVHVNLGNGETYIVDMGRTEAREFGKQGTSTKGRGRPTNGNGQNGN